MKSKKDIGRKAWIAQFHVWWPIVVGLLVLYVPTFFDLGTGIWSSEAYAHGPIILALSLWLIARRWQEMPQETGQQHRAVHGWLLFISGLLLYIIGRSQGLPIFEIASFVFVLAAMVLLLFGQAAFRTHWFPFFFMLFMIPLPGTVVNAITLPMKSAVSYGTEQLLFWVGFPIARSGVILQIGQYQLLVADACAGLQTLLTLEALGLFYLNVVRHVSPFRNIALALLIVPISFSANVIRVSTLTLVTYYLGDKAGQGFLHGFAGLLLFLSALLLIISADIFLQLIVNVRLQKPVLR